VRVRLQHVHGAFAAAREARRRLVVTCCPCAAGARRRSVGLKAAPAFADNFTIQAAFVDSG